MSPRVSAGSGAAAEDGREDPVEGGELGAVGDEGEPGGPVEPAGVRRRQQAQRPGEPRRPVRGGRHARAVQPVGQRGRQRRRHDRSAGVGPTPRCRRGGGCPVRAHLRRRAGADQPGQPGLPDQLLVVAVLEHRAERRLRGGRVQPGHAEQGQRGHPVDRLGDPRRLLQLQGADPGHRRGRGDRERLRAARHPAPDDLHGPLRRRVVDPVVEAAPLQRVVQVAGAVGGQHHDRRVRRPDRAQLRDGHRGLGEQLEGERLEVVVGPVELVDQQHRRPRAGMLQRGQQRPAQQVVRAEQPGLVGAARRGTRRAGCRAAGGRSSTRRAPRRRRCPRSTAAGPAGCPAPGRAPWPPRSCRRPARPPAAAAAAAGRPGTARWRARGR